MKTLHSIPQEKEKFSWSTINSAFNNLNSTISNATQQFQQFRNLYINTPTDYTVFGDTNRTYNIAYPEFNTSTSNSTYIYDEFTRSVANGWGTNGQYTREWTFEVPYDEETSIFSDVDE